MIFDYVPLNPKNVLISTSFYYDTAPIAGKESIVIEGESRGDLNFRALSLGLRILFD